jgi:hypothetical protein
MRKMYKVEVEVYTDCEGRDTAWTVSNEKFETIEEAKATTETIANEFPNNGNYRIVECVMDEATFTYTEKVVYNYNYYMEVTRWEFLEKNIAYVEEALTKAKARKPKTETGEARKEKEIAEYENRLRELKEKKEEWKREG